MSRENMGRRTWAAWVAGVTLTAAVGLMSTGCTIRTQAPIKEIAYDFSDRDFYDRGYAQSPQYAEMEPAYVEQTPLRKRTAAEPVVGSHGDSPSAEGSANAATAGLSAMVLQRATVKAAPIPAPQRAATLPLGRALARSKGGAQ